MNKSAILTIIHDFDIQVIPDFFDLENYKADYVISRNFIKSLSIRYINKKETYSPEEIIYINFKKKYFSINVIYKSLMIGKTIFQDTYQNYDSTEKIYKILLLICKNKDSFSDDVLIFDKIDKQIEQYNILNDYTEKRSLFREIFNQLVNLEIEGKISREYPSKPISYLQQIVENDGPEYCYTIKFGPIWNDKREYNIGVCVRGEPLLKKLN